MHRAQKLCQVARFSNRDGSKSFDVFVLQRTATGAYDSYMQCPSLLTASTRFCSSQVAHNETARPIVLIVCFRHAILAAALIALSGCGRTELFGERPTCAPTDIACQMAIGGGSTGPSLDGGLGGNIPTGNGGADSLGTGGGAGLGSGSGGFGSGVDSTTGIGGNGGTGGGAVACAQMREICNNGKDDNCNGLSDCADPSCFGDPTCSQPGQEICNNGIDDNGNGLVDCADPECLTSIVCRPTPGQEICNNGIDDNGNGLVDCADPQCTTFPACISIDCSVDVDFGTLAAHGARVTRMVDTTGATRSFTTCATPGGHGRVARFVLTTTADVRLDFSQPPVTAAHVVALFRAGANEACDRNPVTCVNAGDAVTTTQTFPALAAGTYWLIVESYPGTPGVTTVTLSTGTTTPEICDNGIDDDGNGLIDCQDLACVNAPNCITVECKPDVTLGALVLGAPAQSVRLVLDPMENRYKPTCAGSGPDSDGGDAAVALTLPEAGGIEVAFNQTGHTIFSLYRQPDPGLACDEDQLTCDFEDDQSGAVALTDEPAGKYILIFKATAPGDEGTLNLRISAFAGRQTEVCGNGIDDDGNGLIDCADPACFGLPMCATPACIPDIDLGTLSWGSTVSTVVDTTGGRDFYQTTCSKGNGGERVLRVTLTEPMALGIDCTDAGSHVIELAQQLAALDACNANDPQCADPAVLPFGCNYEIPDLQPGTYNIIVQAFQAGTEGKVSLTLSGVQEIVREICNNGIDDDGDGFTDCADRKCVTSPECATFACRADKMLGDLPLDGTVVSAVIQTTGAGDNEMQTSCVSAPGGQDGDVDFQLPAKANLTLEWAQVGNHDFALYSDDGMLLSCEAGTSYACVSSNGQSTGTTVIPALPPGLYHLIVDADKPGDEGGVALQLFAKPSP